MTIELGYEPKDLLRELDRHYICASEDDILEMLNFIGLNSLEELYSHISDDIKFGDNFNFPDELSYDELAEKVTELSNNNIATLSFVGDGLQNFKVPSITKDILNIRGLTTAYTPYQPERSQGTLITHWIYASLLSQLTGFEAVNASMYDRSTALFEALNTALRIKKKTNTVIVFETIYPGDKEVLITQSIETKLNIEFLECDWKTGCVNLDDLKLKISELGDSLAAVAFPQINHFGIIENVDEITNIIHENKLLAIGIIDPLLLAKGGLKPPVDFGEKGCDIFVGEGQHLALPPSYGGPGLGVFGIRFNKENKNAIRSTAGRFVGTAKDLFGKTSKVLVLSTREQHIRREKATSNICSNQAYIATLAGASILSRGEEGLADAIQTAMKNTKKAFEGLTSIKGVEPLFPSGIFFNEFSLKLPIASKELILKGIDSNIVVGVDISSRFPNGGNLLLVSCSDKQSIEEIENLIALFKKVLNNSATEGCVAPEIKSEMQRLVSPEILKVDDEEIVSYYNKLGELNASPDDSCYPLGSCTMKYNPYINDYAAGLKGFLENHPEDPEMVSQGSMEILYKNQEWFKNITGLPGVTIQPLAGAQGELVGLKMFQAYHRDRGDLNRDIVLIPSSAHGTNPATTTVAGYETKKIEGIPHGIITIESDQTGQISMNHLNEILNDYGDRIAGIMVTNPNTCGVMESNFKEFANKVHEVGGLVYMDGANMNAIAGWLDLEKMGVDAVHQNLHKTWSIPHGGGGPGDGIVAVSEKLIDFLPGKNIEQNSDGSFKYITQEKSIGSVHRHFGNFGHKVRCYTYLARLGKEGIKKMSAVAVLSARYLHKKLSAVYPTLPMGASESVRMHEFIITLSEETFSKIVNAGVPKPLIISRVGKLFLDFGFHAPTVAFPEAFGLMIEPTESYTKKELDRFCDTAISILELIEKNPEVLLTVPHFTPVARIDDVAANKELCLREKLISLPELNENEISTSELRSMPFDKIKELVLQKHLTRTK
ncbi:MAG: glycine dehydrogenase [Planctomycetota bacterium]|nr:MAG: glycine dehydrogenase [Planctomycetota bacterium]